MIRSGHPTLSAQIPTTRPCVVAADLQCVYAYDEQPQLAQQYDELEHVVMNADRQIDIYYEVMSAGRRQGGVRSGNKCEAQITIPLREPLLYILAYLSS